MSEPIEQGSCQSFITKHLGPIRKAQIGRHNHRHSLVQGRTELKDQLRPGGGEGNKAQLVQDDQTMPESRGHRKEAVLRRNLGNWCSS